MRRVLCLIVSALPLAACSAIPTRVTWVIDETARASLETQRIPSEEIERPGRVEPFVLVRAVDASLPPGFERFRVVKDQYANEVDLSDRHLTAEIRRIEKSLGLKPVRIIRD